MDLSVKNVSAPTCTGGERKLCNLGTDYNKQPVRVGNSHSNDNNLQLVHLLTTNPAAALPAIFPATGSPQKVFARQTCHVTRPRMSNHGHNSWRGGANNSWAASIMNEKIPFRRQRSFSELYVSKEDFNKNACCIDKEGNFDFEALLPVVYWRPEFEKDV